ncbi:MAG: gliding motility-associated C-terminal domain-containing protein [Lewinellaceae bacterium]|nr:gliding motility-associated C-terminal domain-containing protein [Lewinellaceae bacterium]
MPVVTIPGIYTLTVTNSNNTCTATAQTNVGSDLTPPVADAGANPTIDCITTSTSIGGSSSSGPNFTYLWSGPGINSGNEGILQPVVSAPGSYSLIVTNTINGCTATDNLVVNTDAVYPAVSAGADGLITCLQPAPTLDGTGSTSGAGFQVIWAGPGITAGNQNQLSPSVTIPGIYILSVTNTTNSCVSKDTVVVTQNTTLPSASAEPDGTLNCAITSITLDGTGSYATSGFSCTWTGPGNFTSNIPTPVIATPGTYNILVVNDANGCTATDQVFINQDITLPLADAGAGLTLTCSQPDQAINGSGSSGGPFFSYLWQGPGINTGNFNLQNPVVSDSGNYVLIVTNLQNSCTATDQVLIAMDADPPAADAGIDQTLTCQQDTLQLDGSLSASGPGIQYTWSGPGIIAGQQNVITPAIFTQGIYTLSVLNTTNGCTKTDIVNVGADFIPPVSDAGSDLVLTCANSTSGVTLSSGSSSVGAGFSLQWSGPGITPANQNNPNPTVLVVGDYTLLVTNIQNGCTSADVSTVIQDQNLPIANAGTDQTITCSVLQVALDGSGSSSSGGSIQYEWVGPGISIANQNDAAPTVSVSGSYMLTVTNPITGCKASDNVVVLLDNQPPQISVSTDTINCDEPQGALSATSSLLNSTYEWSGPGINIGNINLASMQVNEPGSYSVTVTAPNGCTQTASAEMFVDADFPEGAAEGAELNCYNNGIGIISGEVITPGATFAWTGPGGFQSNALAPTVTQTGTYIFTITSPNGCKRPIPVNVTQDMQVPQASAFVSELLDCNTNSLTINTAGTSTGPIYTYTWTTTGGQIVSGANSLSPVVDAPGQYTLLVSNNLNGCTNTVTIPVATDPSVPDAFDLAVKNIRCYGDQNGFITVNDVIGGTEPFIFSLDGSTGSSPDQFSGLAAGVYTLTMLDANGCMLDTVITISEPGQLLVDLGPDIEVQLGEEATVAAEISNSTPIQGVAWNYAPNCDSSSAVCEEFTYLPLHSYRHEITVKDVNGCVSRDQVNVIVKKNRLVYVPNVFNPNSQEPLNNQLMIQGGTGVVRVVSWQIYDRWGGAVFGVNDFPPNDPAYAWSGRVKGNQENTGVYTWFAEIEFVDGAVELFKGDVTIVR